ncbi:hypothetical protein [Helicobacter pylori]|uniref:hypothetical protein n=1 Tax=Helicobacter pylori TaxID=210 RepID=UPI000EAEFB18|nr:hypothetical protein [Helicobacter pylori]RKV31658.1 hypothetical protein DD756_03610 [Helicobacter pylori]
MFFANPLNTPNYFQNNNFFKDAPKNLGLINYTSNTEGFELSFLNNAKFANLTTHSIPTDYNNDWVFHKHSQALVYEILE